MPRRLHAASGAWLTVFLAVHLLLAVTGLWPQRYQFNIDSLKTALSYLPGFQAITIYLPLAVQAGSGLYLLRQEGLSYQLKRCNRGGKVRFFAQRVTAIAVFAFLVAHVGTLAGGWFDAQHAFRSTASAFRSAQSAGMIAALAGIWAAVFHAANGAWTGALVWNLLPSADTKRRWAYLCLGFGVALVVAATVAWYAFTCSPHARL